MPAQTKMIANLKNHFEGYTTHMHRHSVQLDQSHHHSKGFSRLHVPRRSLNIDRPKSPKDLKDSPLPSPKSGGSPQRSPTFFHRKLHLSRSLPSFKMSSSSSSSSLSSLSSSHHGNHNIPHVDQSIINSNMLSLLTLGQLPEDEEVREPFLFISIPSYKKHRIVGLSNFEIIRF